MSNIYIYVNVDSSSVNPWFHYPFSNIYFEENKPAHRTTAFRTLGRVETRPARTGVGAWDGEYPDFGDATCRGQFSFKFGG